MADLLTNGITWQQAQLKEHAGETVTLRRTGETDVSVVMTPGDAVQAAEDIEGLTHEERSQDWIIPAADYKFAGDPVDPAHSDEIRQTVGSDVYVYAVLPTGNRDNLFRTTGTKVRMLRVHTKLIDIE